jgi:TRAP-type C4-dicarboxylate transport system permease small subunit
LIAIMAVMVVLVSTQVFLRYVLNSSIDVADELSRLLFVWSIFLAIPHGVKVGAHVGVDVLVVMLPARTQGVVHRILCVLGALLMATVGYQAIRVANGSWDEPLATLNVPSALFFLAVGLGAGHSLLHLVDLAWTGVRPQAAPRE